MGFPSRDPKIPLRTRVEGQLSPHFCRASLTERFYRDCRGWASVTRAEVRDSSFVNLSSSDWQVAVAVSVSVLGLIATLYTAFGSTARRLRNDLAIDVKLVFELEGDVRDDLQGSVTERSYRLIAATKFPSVTWYEAALALLLIPVFWWLFSAPNEVRSLAEQGEVTFELSGPGQAVALTVAYITYAALVRSWSSRAAARVVYVYRRLGDEEARALVRLLAFPAHLVPVGFVSALALSLLLNVKEITEAFDWQPGAAVLITTAISMILILVTFRIARREDLFEQMRFYTDIMHIGADIPRLRPVGLGRTEEDLARYKSAFDRRFPGRRRAKE